MPRPSILLIAPPPIQTPKGLIAPKFQGGKQKCVGVAQQYSLVAEEMSCLFFDVGSIVSSSDVDGIHLDKNEHSLLGIAIQRKLESPLSSKNFPDGDDMTTYQEHYDQHLSPVYTWMLGDFYTACLAAEKELRVVGLIPNEGDLVVDVTK